jgi:hypothetical protein
MLVTPEIRAMILERASAGQIRKAAAAQGMMSLREDGWRLVRSARTTVEEVLRVTKDERLGGNGNGTEDAPGPPGLRAGRGPYGKPNEAAD